MFLIDPNSYHESRLHDNAPEEIIAIYNLYSEILKRALEDLRYYKQSDNIDRWVRADAYNAARNAQSWIDGLIDSCAIKCDFILDILQIEKSHIDAYIDKYEIRFDYNDKSPEERAGRKAYEIRSESPNSDRKDLYPLWINRRTASPVSRG